LHKLIDEYMARTLAAAFTAMKSETPSEERKPPVFSEERNPPIAALPRTDASLTSAAAHVRPGSMVPPASEPYIDDVELSAHLVPYAEAKKPAVAAPQRKEDARMTAVAVAPKAMPVASPAPEAYEEDFESSARLVLSPESSADLEMEPIPSSPSFDSRAWRAEAWKREREREQRNSRNTVRPRRRSLV
jgi:hypothetical protein